MKNYRILFFIIAFCTAIGCASTPAQEVKKDTPAPDMPDISSLNQQLVNRPISGFAYKSSKLDTGKWDEWARNTAPLVKEIIDKLPDGYALQVTGHADASGPEEPEGNKPGNIKISSDRAKTVYDSLKRANIDSPKITYKGIGSDELLSGYGSRDAAQRRVTFKIVKE